MKADSDELLSTLEQKVSPAHAALLVVDVQNDFVADWRILSPGRRGREEDPAIDPAAVQLIDRAREAGVLVVFIQAIYDPQYVSPPMRERDIRVGRTMSRCLTGSWGAELVIAPRPGDEVVIKHRYSAFAHTELDELLKRRGIRSLLLTGVSTDTCVESTGRDGYFIDYYVTMVKDCCAGASDRDHSVAVERFERDYGPAVNSADVIDAWERSGALMTRRVAARAG